MQLLGLPCTKAAWCDSSWRQVSQLLFQVQGRQNSSSPEELGPPPGQAPQLQFVHFQRGKKDTNDKAKDTVPGTAARVSGDPQPFTAFSPNPRSSHVPPSVNRSVSSSESSHHGQRARPLPTSRATSARVPPTCQSLTVPGIFVPTLTKPFRGDRPILQKRQWRLSEVE